MGLEVALVRTEDSRILKINNLITLNQIFLFEKVFKDVYPNPVMIVVASTIASSR